MTACIRESERIVVLNGSQKEDRYQDVFLLLSEFILFRRFSVSAPHLEDRGVDGLHWPLVLLGLAPVPEQMRGQQPDQLLRTLNIWS